MRPMLEKNLKTVTKGVNYGEQFVAISLSPDQNCVLSIERIESW
jgi:hypothetical protein